MKKPLVVITYPMSKKVLIKELIPHARVILARSPSALKKALKNADGFIPLVSEPVSDELLSHAPRLKVIGNFGVGVNNIDLAACRRRGIRVTNTPHVLTRATAELTLALLFATARRIPEGEQMCRSGKFPGWAPDMLLGHELIGRHAVIVGAGRIGKETARLFRAVGIRVEFITRQDSEKSISAKLRDAQILSLHIPLSTTNHHWLNSKRLALLPRDAIVLNTSRGPVVDETALVAALEKKKIFAAGLDVFEKEPSIPMRLRRLQNVVLLPHLGSATATARDGMARLAVTGVLSILGGKRPPNEVKITDT